MGLVPFWSKDIKVGFANINAMAETIDTKPAFREAFQRRRCLVPVDNFYEWKKTETGKQPYAIALADRRLMALAGLWENWRSPAGEWVRSFAIITTKPNELCAELHNRMPVVLKPKDWPPWLAEEPADAARLKSMLGPYPSKEMTCWPVSQRPMKVKQLGVTAPTHRSADLTRRTARMGLVGAGRAAGIHNVAADHQALAPGAVSSCRSRARRRVALRRR